MMWRRETILLKRNEEHEEKDGGKMIFSLSNDENSLLAWLSIIQFDLNLFCVYHQHGINFGFLVYEMSVCQCVCFENIILFNPPPSPPEYRWMFMFSKELSELWRMYLMLYVVTCNHSTYYYTKHIWFCLWLPSHHLCMKP